MQSNYLSNIDQGLQTYIFSYLTNIRDLTSVRLVDHKCRLAVKDLFQGSVLKKIMPLQTRQLTQVTSPVPSNIQAVNRTQPTPASALQYTDVQRQSAFEQIQTEARWQGGMQPLHLSIRLVNVLTNQEINWDRQSSPSSAYVAHNTPIAIAIFNPAQILSTRVVAQVVDRNDVRIPLLQGSRQVVDLLPRQSDVMQSLIAQSTTSPIFLNFLAAPLNQGQHVPGSAMFHTRLSVHVLPDQTAVQEQKDSPASESPMQVETDSLPTEPALEEKTPLPNDEPELEEERPESEKNMRY